MAKFICHLEIDGKIFYDQTITEKQLARYGMLKNVTILAIMKLNKTNKHIKLSRQLCIF